MDKTIKLLACSKNRKLYKTTTGKIYSRHKLISLIKNNKAIIKTSSGAEVSLFSFKGKEFLQTNHNNKERDNLSETLLPFSVLKHHSWLLAGLLCLGIIASNVIYPLIILDERKTHKTELSSFIAEIDLGEIESDTGPAIQSRAVELNSKASDLDWSQLTFTQITSTGAHIDAKNDSKSYSGHVNVVFSIPPIIEYNTEGTNWPGYISGSLSCLLDEKSFTCRINGYSNDFAANNLIIPQTVLYNNDEYTVVQINKQSFRYADQLTGNLTLPDTITSIGSYAFQYCQNLSGRLVLPDSLISLGQSAFFRCSFTGELILSSNPSFTTIDYETFRYCSFSSITIPNNITTLRYACFSDCSNITSITIPNSVNYIEPYAFGYMSNCTSITCDYASEPTDIDDGFMWYCSNTGIVQNTNSAYSSEQLLAFLKTKSLPNGWIAIQ